MGQGKQNRGREPIDSRYWRAMEQPHQLAAAQEPVHLASTGHTPSPLRAAWPVLVVLLASLAARTWYASSKSLVLDEFHSTYHAFQAPRGAFLEALALDNHPPLSFLLIGTASEALGRSELALRSPALLLGLLEIALVFRLAVRAGAGRRGALMAATLLATSAMHFDYGTQARMYVPLALFITCCLGAAVDLLRSEVPRRGPLNPRGGLALGLAATAALYTHYFAFHYLGCLAVAAAVALAMSSQRPRRLVLPLVGAAVAFLPWALTGFREQLGHGLPPGGDDLSVKALVQAFTHLFAHNTFLGGPTGRWVFVGGAGLALLLAARGALEMLRDPERRAAGLVIATVAFVVPVAAWVLAALSPRSGFTWHYVLPSAGAAAVLAGVGARGAAWGLVATAQIALGCALIVLHLVNPATENFRGAIAHALERHAAARGEDARLVAVEWQPALFPQGRPFDYYAPRLTTPAAPPARMEMIEGQFMVSDRAALLAADRVIVINRSLPGSQMLTSLLRETFPHRIESRFGFGIDVTEYARRP